MEVFKVNGEGSVLGRKPVFGTVGERMHTHAFILLTTSRESLPPVEGRDRGARSVVQIIYSLEGPYMHGDMASIASAVCAADAWVGAADAKF